MFIGARSLLKKIDIMLHDTGLVVRLSTVTWIGNRKFKISSCAPAYILFMEEFEMQGTFAILMPPYKPLPAASECGKDGSGWAKQPAAAGHGRRIGE
jgi:hypothetical protein